MSGFDGRRVLVTGSTRGIGRAAAAMFHVRGAAVIVHGREAAAVEAAIPAMQQAGKLALHGLAADLERRDDCRRLAEAAGDLDVLVNCAGIYAERPIAASDHAFWDRMAAINLTAPWLLSQALLPGLRRRRGIIVNIASEAALLGFADTSVYSAMKGALVGLTRALAVEAAPDVRAIAVCPGPVDTDMAETIFRASADPAAARRQWEGGPMLRRMATAEEIAETIVFAASPAARYVTGAIIAIDGGATAGKRLADQP